MRILFIGDVFGSAGRDIAAAHVPRLNRELKIDLCICNVENAAGGFGVTPQIAEEILKLGVDVMTSGNHIWDKREIYEYLAREPRLLRPANYPDGAPGSGLALVKSKGGIPCAVINLQGRASMQPLDDPFRKFDELSTQIPQDTKIRFVDFHAELTSEKVAFGWHCDGRATAVIGTHTHIPTADTRILPGGTAYQTDCGMTGPYDSVIGVDKDTILKKFLGAMPVRMEPAKHGAELHAVFIDANELTGKARTIERITAD